jgi:hypothetical protein
MTPWLETVIVMIGIGLIIVIGLVVNRQRRTVSLRNRFGPEYTRSVEAAGGRRTAEADLQERARRRSQLSVIPLTEPVRLRHVEQWRVLQEHFVDHPTEAVDDAEDLLTVVMRERGYPVGEFDRQAEFLSVDHPHVVENYRIAHEIHLRNQTHQATTEDLREAMLRYRSLFDDLLRPGQGQSGQGRRPPRHRSSEGVLMTERPSSARSPRPTDPRAAETQPAEASAAQAQPPQAQPPASALFSGPDSPDLEAITRRWREIQATFVDSPQQAVRDADALVTDLLNRLTQLLTAEHHHLESRWNRGNDQLSTEDLRMALQHYRSFFQRLLSIR